MFPRPWWGLSACLSLALVSGAAPAADEKAICGDGTLDAGGACKAACELDPCASVLPRCGRRPGHEPRVFGGGEPAPLNASAVWGGVLRTHATLFRASPFPRTWGAAWPDVLRTHGEPGRALMFFHDHDEDRT
jgi:hypothetical protein